MGTRVYIGRLPYRATERDIERFFRGYGRIREIFLKNGYGFIEFEDYRDADDACVELNGREMLGERVIVEIARGTPHGRDRFGWRPSYTPYHGKREKRRSRSRSHERSRSRSYERDRRRRESPRRRSRSRSRSLPLENVPKRSRSVEKARKMDSPEKNGNSDVGSVSDSGRRSASYSRSPTPEGNDKNKERWSERDAIEDEE
uniref:RRM domain-containing protein n=1 Tax=Trichuris muris TaxID=70415 RepID=A0A5S6QR22_TRIMR